MSKKYSKSVEKKKRNRDAARQRDIGVQNLADVDVTLQDAWKRRRGSAGKLASETWLEKLSSSCQGNLDHLLKKKEGKQEKKKQ